MPSSPRQSRHGSYERRRTRSTASMKFCEYLKCPHFFCGHIGRVTRETLGDSVDPSGCRRLHVAPEPQVQLRSYKVNAHQVRKPYAAFAPYTLCHNLISKLFRSLHHPPVPWKTPPSERVSWIFRSEVVPSLQAARPDLISYSQRSWLWSFRSCFPRNRSADHRCQNRDIQNIGSERRLLVAALFRG